MNRLAVYRQSPDSGKGSAEIRPKRHFTPKKLIRMLDVVCAFFCIFPILIAAIIISYGEYKFSPEKIAAQINYTHQDTEIDVQNAAENAGNNIASILTENCIYNGNGLAICYADGDLYYIVPDAFDTSYKFSLHLYTDDSSSFKNSDFNFANHEIETDPDWDYRAAMVDLSDLEITKIQTGQFITVRDTYVNLWNTDIVLE